MLEQLAHSLLELGWALDPLVQILGISVLQLLITEVQTKRQQLWLLQLYLLQALLTMVKVTSRTLKEPGYFPSVLDFFLFPFLGDRD